jgi:hypothetical protein
VSNQNIIRPPKRLSGDTEAVVRHIYDQINILSNATNRASTGEARDRTGGTSGDLQLVHDKASGQYGIEGRFNEGWMRFGLGEGVLVQSNQRGPFFPPKKDGSDTIMRSIQSMFPPITTLRLNVYNRTISLPIEPIGTSGIIRGGDIITVASLNGYSTSFVVTADVSDVANTISVEDKILGNTLIAGSAVYLTQKSLGTWINELENSITIGAGINNFDVIARVNGALSGSVSNIPLKSALTVKLRNNWKLLVTDLGSGDVFVVQVFGDHNIGATSINIYTATVTCDDNSPIRLDQLSLLAYINITATDISLSSQAMQGGLFVGETLYSTAVGSHSSIWIASPGVAIDLEAGQVLIIQDKDDPSNMLEIVLQSDQSVPVSPAVQILWINTVSNPKLIAAGSKIFIPPRIYSGQIKVAFDEIELSVKREELRSSLNGKLLGEVNTVSGSSITLKSPFLKHTVYKDDTVTFAPNAAFNQTEGTNPTVKKTITKSGSPAYWGAASSSITLDSYTGISADMLMYMDNAGPVSIGSSLQVFVDSIEIDTPVLRSKYYSPGVSGWAINHDGSAEFQDVYVRGDLQSKEIGPTYTTTTIVDSGIIDQLVTQTSGGAPVIHTQLGSGIEGYGLVIANENLNNQPDFTANFRYLKADFNQVVFGYGYGFWPTNEIFKVTNGASGVITSFGAPVPRVFTGSGNPGSITGSTVGDFYRDTASSVNKIWMKVTNPSTWIFIGASSANLQTMIITNVANNENPANYSFGTMAWDNDYGFSIIKRTNVWETMYDFIKSVRVPTTGDSLGVVPLWRGILSAHPSNPQDGHMYKNTTDGSVYIREAGSWQSII